MNGEIIFADIEKALGNLKHIGAGAPLERPITPIPTATVKKPVSKKAEAVPLDYVDIPGLIKFFIILFKFFENIKFSFQNF